MRKADRLCVRMLVALVCLMSAALCAPGWAQTITVGNANGDAGTTVTVSVTLSTGGQTIAGTQNDITLDPAFGSFASSVDDPTTPDCTPNSAIGKEGTSFNFLPAGCSGVSCTGVRSLVFSLKNTTAIPDGSVLYTCNINIAAGATGCATLTALNVSLSDPSGGNVYGSGANGQVCVTGASTPTPTTPPAPTPTPTGPAVIVGNASGAAGSTVTVSVTLKTDGQTIAGTQNDITLDPAFGSFAPSPDDATTPDCTPNAAIKKEGTSFNFQPAGCSGAACTGIRSLAFSLKNTTAIPDGSVLYTCNINIAAGATGCSTLDVTGVSLSAPSGGNVAGTSVNGQVCVFIPPCLDDVDGSGRPVDIATDVVYITRRLLGLAPVPTSFRTVDPNIPSDALIAANIDALCPPLHAPPTTPTPTPGPNDCCACGTFACGPVEDGQCFPGCMAIRNASCSGVTGLCSTFTPAPTASPTPTPGADDCCQCSTNTCGPVLAGMCAVGCTIVRNADCSGSTGNCVPR